MNSGFDALQSLQTAFTTLMAYLPQLLGALLVLLVGWVVAKLVDKGVTALLRKVRIDERLGDGMVAKVSPARSPARLVGGMVQRTMGARTLGRVAATAAPALIMAIAVFMILTQLGIAPVIVTATYIALVGALALAAALAFGLGGRDAAAQMIASGLRQAQQPAVTNGVAATNGAGTQEHAHV